MMYAKLQRLEVVRGGVLISQWVFVTPSESNPACEHLELLVKYRVQYRYYWRMDTPTIDTHRAYGPYAQCQGRSLRLVGRSM